MAQALGISDRPNEDQRIKLIKEQGIRAYNTIANTRLYKNVAEGNTSPTQQRFLQEQMMLQQPGVLNFMRKAGESAGEFSKDKDLAQTLMLIYTHASANVQPYAGRQIPKISPASIQFLNAIQELQKTGDHVQMAAAAYALLVMKPTEAALVNNVPFQTVKDYIVAVRSQVADAEILGQKEIGQKETGVPRETLAMLAGIVMQGDKPVFPPDIVARKLLPYAGTAYEQSLREGNSKIIAAKQKYYGTFEIEP